MTELKSKLAVTPTSSPSNTKFVLIIIIVVAYYYSSSTLV